MSPRALEPVGPEAALGPPPPVDPALREILAALRPQRPPLTLARVQGARAAAAADRLSDAEIGRGGAFTIREQVVPVAGGAIGMLICRAAAAAGPQPVIYNIHGGGMVAGHNRTRELLGDLDRAQALGCTIVAVNYRLAPEHPDPVPVEDCYAGLCWLASNAEALGIDATRIVLSGNSAGGGLAAGVALLARDRGGPALRGQMLQCPMLDDRCRTASARQMVDVGLWDTPSNLTGWTALLGDQRGGPSVSAYAAPARAADLSGLAPAFIDVGAVEALRDEAVDYAGRIWAAGGEAELHVWAGAFHCFDQWVPLAPVSRGAEQIRLNWLQRMMADATTAEHAKGPAS